MPSSILLTGAGWGSQDAPPGDVWNTVAINWNVDADVWGTDVDDTWDQNADVWGDSVTQWN